MRRTVTMGMGLALAGAGLLFAQGSGERAGAGGSATTARASLADASGRAVGDATLRQTPHGVLLEVTIRNAPPGVHAFHIHETGRCDAPTFESAGSHFAPAGRQHGFLNRNGHHAGDLPNVQVPASGEISLEKFIPGLSLVDGEAPLLDGDGASLVVHENPDDHTSDPAGNGGARIACGVIARQAG